MILKGLQQNKNKGNKTGARGYCENFNFTNKMLEALSHPIDNQQSAWEFTLWQWSQNTRQIFWKQDFLVIL